MCKQGLSVRVYGGQKLPADATSSTVHLVFLEWGSLHVWTSEYNFW